MKYLYFSDPSTGGERGFYSAFTDNYFFSHKSIMFYTCLLYDVIWVVSG